MKSLGYTKTMKYLVFILTVFIGFNTMADYESYDEIVDKLSKYTTTEVTTKPRYTDSSRTFSTAHLGLGFTQTFYDADATNFNSRMQNQGGFLVTVGVDLLNEKWGIEGSYINYGKLEASNSSLKLKEFTIRGLYKPSIAKNWNMRLGLGVSSRFLDIANAEINQSYKTPNGLFLFGIESYMNSFISVGADLSFKTAMINDTIDKNSIDLAFKVDTHF